MKKAKDVLDQLKLDFYDKVKPLIKDCCEQSSICSDIKNRRFSKNTIKTLEASFIHEPYPSEHEKERIGKLCQLNIRQVNNWFTNKRNRSRY